MSTYLGRVIRARHEEQLLPGGSRSLAKIVIIDDDISLRTAMRKMLERCGHAVREAPDGKVGLDLVRDGVPDLVISELIMPEAEGVETIMAIRQEFPTLKVLAVSGAGSADDWEPLKDAELLGANASLAKPFRAEDLCTIVDGLLNSE